LRGHHGKKKRATQRCGGKKREGKIKGKKKKSKTKPLLQDVRRDGRLNSHPRGGANRGEKRGPVTHTTANQKKKDFR